MIDLWLRLGLTPQNDRDSAMYQLYDTIPETEKEPLYAELIKEDGLHYIAQRIKEVIYINIIMNSKGLLLNII